MLRLRVALGTSVLVIGLLMSLTGTTVAASNHQAIVQQDVCTYHGGAHGRGYILLKVKVREVGTSNVNYFKIISKLQWNSGVTWGTKSTYPPETSSHFADDSVTHYRVVTRRYDFTPNDEISTRIQMKVQFWSDADGLVETKTVNGEAC